MPRFLLSLALICKLYEGRDEDNLLPGSSKELIKQGRIGEREGRAHSNTVVPRICWRTCHSTVSCLLPRRPAALPPQAADSVDLGWGLRIYICNKFLAHHYDVSLELTF